MLRLEMLPATCGVCLWLEYGTPPAMRVVIIDGGLKDTAAVLRERIAAACRERGTATLEVELLVVTHVDNDHIVGIIELLAAAPPSLRVKDVWFNGRPQLVRLPPPPPSERRKRRKPRARDMMGGGDENPEDEEASVEDLETAAPSAADLLGPQQGDDLSKLLARRGLPWNRHARWNGEAIAVPATGDLPAVTLEGELTLTVLGPTLARLYDLCVAWPDVLGGTDEPATREPPAPADLLGRSDSWPPVWKDGEADDPSDANGSSIMLLAEHGGHALLLPGDGHAPDLAAALERLCRQRGTSSGPLSIDAFKLPHHGSAKNLTRAVLEKLDCSRYLVSTDGSKTYRHPDHQALLRILRYSRRRPRLLFNYDVASTRPWRDSKSDVVGGKLQDYDTEYPTDAADGLRLDLT